jgi:hypothetical protein
MLIFSKSVASCIALIIFSRTDSASANSIPVISREKPTLEPFTMISEALDSTLEPSDNSKWDRISLILLDLVIVMLANFSNYNILIQVGLSFSKY